MCDETCINLLHDHGLARFFVDGNGQTCDVHDYVSRIELIRLQRAATDLAHLFVLAETEGTVADGRSVYAAFGYGTQKSLDSDICGGRDYCRTCDVCQRFGKGAIQIRAQSINLSCDK